MAKKKRKKSYERITGYVDKPSFEKYKENIESSSPEVREHLYQIQKLKEKKYYKQEAEIKAGIKPSRAQARFKKAKTFVQKFERRTKQPKFSKAVMGLAGAFMPESAGGFQYSQSSSGKVRVKEGRGRPRGTFKQRFVPGYGVVSVPTNIYNRMVAEAKAKRRLAEAKRQAMYQQQYEAEQIAMQQDPRFQQSAEDAWAESEDLDHEANVARIQQQQQFQQQMSMQKQAQPSLIQRGVRGVVDQVGRISLMGTEREQFQRQGREPPQQLDPYGRPQIDITRHQPIEPKITLFTSKISPFSKDREIVNDGRNIMNQRNELF